jgi:hypothetical protein
MAVRFVLDPEDPCPRVGLRTAGTSEGGELQRGSLVIRAGLERRLGISCLNFDDQFELVIRGHFASE